MGAASADLVADLLAGDRRALARVLTRIEDGAGDVVRPLIAGLHPHTGEATLVGVTGAPGAGKSTLVDALIGSWRAAGQTVGVLAIDPSSPFSGGALLGDRVRMQDHVLDEGVFIRSMASRGQLGGLSWSTPQALLALDAAGFDVLLVETVGVGQGEVEVAGLADTTVVVVAPGMGDAVQAAKAGILEVADVFCVNKADRPGASRTARELRELQMLGNHDGADTPIVLTTASSGEGIEELRTAVADHRTALEAGDELAARRRARARLQIRELALGTVRARTAAVRGAASLDALAVAVADRELDPYSAADRLLDALDGA
ncbi:MAG: methylmalonyl Co-A mutase-associated GTPase MeaB [Actinobacteria bacterium]|nr:methylmalonyl Co-A mutase-associated GTPase MeaB [Actinomycetota bacterium]